MFALSLKNLSLMRLRRAIYPPTRQAAVLVLLFEQDGELRVLLTTRSKKLRTHPGQTALPGGGKDDEDRSIIDTAVCCAT